MPVSERFEFTVTHDGKDYACERLVTGTRVLTQTITVYGNGSKPDNSYGARGHPINTMESVASLIALDIIREGRARA